jgi:hypothetical protein
MPKTLSGGKFEVTDVIKVNWPGHGFMTQPVRVHMRTLTDGIVVAVSFTEWKSVSAPLLVKQKDGKWYFAGVEVEVHAVGGRYAQENRAEYLKYHSERGRARRLINGASKGRVIESGNPGS